MDGTTESILQRGHLTNHCLLVETSMGLVLVDTGLGLRDVAEPKSRLSAFFLGLLSPDFREEMTAARQIERLGYRVEDVRHIVLTHLDFDHAGGLDDFPNARVHLLQSEERSAAAQKTWLDRQRYRPQQWSSRGRWISYDGGGGDSWFGFESVRVLEGMHEEIALIPLVGHTFGHAGVAVRAENKWYLQAGDAYFYHGEMDHDHPHCTPGLALYQRMMDKDHKRRVLNQKRLRELRRSHQGQVEIFCSHDVAEFERLSGRSAEVPAEKILSLQDLRGAA